MFWNYLYLVIAVLFEVIATTALKETQGFTRLIPSLVVVAGYGLAFYFLSLPLRALPIGVVYALWSGAGIVLITTIGWIWFRQALDLPAVVGMGFTLSGLIGLAYAGSYGLLLLSAARVGIGSSIFHPEATRMARNASGGQHGLAQGIFQLGGQTGGALGPLLAAFVIVPRGQGSLAWFSVAALSR